VRRPQWSRAALAAIAAALALGGAAMYALMSRPGPALPAFRQITLRQGLVVAARFAPDGAAIVYSASWDGKPVELFSTRLGSYEARPLGLGQGRLAAISGAGDLAVVFEKDPRGFAGGGMLSRVPLAGGVPRELVDDVEAADWDRTGSELAVVRRVGNNSQVEFPVGHVIYKSPQHVSWLRVSPAGQHLAALEGVFDEGDVILLDKAGSRRVLSKGWNSAFGLAWSPAGGEIWFTATRDEKAPALQSVTLDGRERLLAAAPDPLFVQDAFQDKALVIRISGRETFSCLAPGEAVERELGWFDGSSLEAISADGKTALFGEDHAGGGVRGGVYIRPTDGSAAVRLADGYPEDLSPDGKWVLARPVKTAHSFVLYPTGAGTSKPLPSGSVTRRYEADWLPGGRGIVFTGSEEGHGLRIYVQDILGGLPRAISPEDSVTRGVSTPDGAYVVGRTRDRFALYPVDGGAPKPPEGIGGDEEPVQWSSDGHVFVFRGGSLPAQVDRVDTISRRRDTWRRLSPANLTGVSRIKKVFVARDGSAYCYAYDRLLSDLFVVEGLSH